MPKYPKRSVHSIRLVLILPEVFENYPPGILAPPLIKCSALPGSNSPYKISVMDGLTQVRVLRRELGLTQQELGRKSGLSRSFLSQVENGSRVPSLSSLNRISAALGVMPIDVLIRDEHEISERNENPTRAPDCLVADSPRDRGEGG